MRLRHLFTGELTWRELVSLVRGLSPQAAVRTALNDGIPEATGEQLVLADLVDAVNALDWHYRGANTPEKKPQPKAPKPYPRWWEPDQRKKRKQSPERVARLEDARRRKRAREKAIAEGRIA